MNAIRMLALTIAIASGALVAKAQTRPHLGNAAEQKRVGITYHQNEEHATHDQSWAIRSQIFHQDPRAAQGEVVGLIYTDYRPNYYDPAIGLTVNPNNANQMAKPGTKEMVRVVETAKYATTKVFDKSMPSPAKGTIISELPSNVKRVEKGDDIFYIANSYILKQLETEEGTRYVVL